MGIGYVGYNGDIFPAAIQSFCYDLFIVLSSQIMAMNVYKFIQKESAF